MKYVYMYTCSLQSFVPNAHRLVFAFLCVYEGVIEIKVNCMTEITRYLLYCKTLFNEFIVIRNDYKY